MCLYMFKNRFWLNYISVNWRFLKKGEPGEPRRTQENHTFHVPYVCLLEKGEPPMYKYYKKENPSYLYMENYFELILSENTTF